MSKTKLMPFDIEKAKNGAKVVTRDGLPAKIVDYPIKNEDCPILGLVLIDGKEFPLLFTETGNHYNNSESCYDLSIEEEVEEDDSNYDPYKATVESIADMVEKYSELQTLEELKHFYNNVKVKCKEAIEYDKKWCKKQDEKPTNNKPKFKVGDVMRTLEEAKADIIEGLPVVVSIDNVNYHCSCNNETIAIKDQDDYEYPPMNRLEINPDKWYVCTRLTYSVDDRICFQKDFKYFGADILKYDLGFVDWEYSSYFRPWTIQDAKPGDILFHSDTASNGIFIFKEIAQDGEVVCYCDYDSEDGFCFGKGHLVCWADSKILYPATKEQCDFLFQKMKEAGYEWNSDKKELHKIEEVKKRRMTHQELSCWLRDCPEEHREWKFKTRSEVYTSRGYSEEKEHNPVASNILIRRNGGEWQKPLIEI